MFVHNLSVASRKLVSILLYWLPLVGPRVMYLRSYAHSLSYMLNMVLNYKLKIDVIGTLSNVFTKSEPQIHELYWLL